MYLRSSKTELEAAGESTDGLVESTSKLRGEIKALTGGRVDIMLDDDTYKSTYQIMKELSEVWDDLTDITQANILEKIGGKRNANATAALLNSFDIVERAMQTSANSSGSALAENEKYLDSINGKIAQFEAAWQSLSATLISSDFLKSLVSGTTGVVNGLDAIASRFGSIPTLIGGITAAISGFRLSQGQRTDIIDFVMDKDGNKSVRLFNTELKHLGGTIKDVYKTYRQGGDDPINASLNTVGSMVGARLLRSNKEIKEYEHLVNNLNKARQDRDQYKRGENLFDNSKEAKDAIKNYKAAEKAMFDYDARMQASQTAWAQYYRNQKDGTKSFAGFVAEMRKAGTLGKAIGAQFKSIGLNLASMFGSAALSFGISAAVQLAITGIGKIITAQEDLRKKTNEATSAHKESLSSISSYGTEIQSIYDSLNSGTLSVDETIQARQRLMQIQGELQSSYSSEAAGLNQITVGAKEAAAALDELAAKEAKRYLEENKTGLDRAQQEMTSDYSYRTSFKTYDINRDGKAVSDEYKKEQLKAIAESIDNAEIFKFIDKNGTVKLNITGNPDEVLDTIAEIRNAASKAGIDLGKITVSGGKTLDAQLSEWEKNEQERKVKYGDDYIERTNALIKQDSKYLDIQTKINNAQNDYNDALIGSYDSDTARAEALSKRIKQIHSLQNVIDNTEFKGKDGEDIRKVLQDQLDSVIESVSAEELKADLELNINSDTTTESFKDIQNALDRFKDDNGEIKISAILDAKGSDAWDSLSSAAEHYGLTVESLLPILAQFGMIQSDTNQLAFDAASRFAELSSASNAITEQQSALTTALQEQAGNGTLSLATYNSLIATSKDFASTLEYESGAMKINGEMAQKLVEAKTKEQVAEMQLAKSQALERYKQNEAAIESLLQKQEKLKKVHGDLGEAQLANLARWKSENESIMDTVNKYNILIAQLQRTTGAYTQWQNAKQTDNSDSIYKNLVTAKKDIDEALESGQTGKGNDDYTMAVKLLVPDGEDVKSYRDKVLNRYLKLDDDGNLKWEGLGNFLNDAVNKDLMKIESDGSYKVAANKILQDFIDEMKITPEVAKSIFDALEMYDFDFDFSDEEFLDAQNVDLAKQRVQEYQDELSKLQSEYEEIQNNKDLTPEAKTEQLDAVLQKIDDANAKEIIAEVQVDTPTLTDAEAALAGIAQKQDELENAQTTIGVNSDEAKKAQQDLEALQSYVDNLDDKTIEITIADINSRINESLKTMGDYKVGSAPFEAAKADLQSYLDMLDQLPDEVKTKYGIDAEYEDKLRQILDGKVSAKDVTVKVKADTSELEQARAFIDRLGETLHIAFSGGAPSKESYDVDANTDAAKAKIKALETEVVKVKIDGDPGPAKEKIASIQANTPINVIVTADPTLAQAQINSLQANPVVINVSANVAAAQVQIAALSAQIDGTSHTVTVSYNPDTSLLPTSFSSLSRTVNYIANTRGLPTRLSPITRTVNYVSTGADHINGTAHANGTVNQSGDAMAGGNWGAKSGGMTLVGELGREIVVDPHSGQWYTVGDYGAEFVNIPKGSIVFNHKQTEALLEKGYVLGRASALVSGTAMVTGGGKPPTSNSSSSNTKNKTTTTKTVTSNSNKKTGSTSKKTTTTTTVTADINVDVRLKDKDLEEKMKDELSTLSENFDYIIGQYEHQILLGEHNRVDYAEIVAVYKQMMDEVHAQAELYRSKGLSDNSKTVQEMQAKWLDYYDKMRDVIKEHYEDERKAIENTINVTEKLYDAAARENDYAKMQGYTDQIVAYNKQLQELAHETAEYFRSIGLDDTSDEITEMKMTWLEASEAIRDAKQAIVDHLVDLVSKASDAIDDLESAFKSFETAAEEYTKTGGFITLDTFQELMTVGPQYMQLLKDENGLLVINRENVEKLMAARVRDLAVQAMLSYAQRVYNAAQEGAVEDLHNLIYATNDATDATFNLAYATLAAAKLTQDEYEAALFNMNALYSLYTNTVSGLSHTMGNEAEKVAESMNNIIEYVMDMLEDRINEQIDHLNDLVDDYKDIVDLKKESLKITKEENEYQKSLRKKLKDMAKLQERINDLALDDSREAQAERAKLLDEFADLQDEVNEAQADKAYDVQTEALDKQYDAYKKEKDKEIEALEKSISSYMKKWDMAIEYTQSHWDTLYDELISWNTEMGNSLNSEITEEWRLATKALEQYGSVLAAVAAQAANMSIGGIQVEPGNVVSNTSYNSIPQGLGVIEQMMANSNKWNDADEAERRALAQQNQELGNSLKLQGIDARRDSSGTWYVGNSNKFKLYDMYQRYMKDGDIQWLKNPEQVTKQRDIIAKMKANSAKWSTYDRSTEDGKKKQDELNAENLKLGEQLTAAGLPVKRGQDGVWYIVATGEKLFSKYHTGGIVGTKANVKQDEVLAVLQKGEAVLDEKKQNGLYRLIDFTTVLSDKLGVALKNIDSSIFGSIRTPTLMPQVAGVAPTIQNSPTINFGDTYIYGGNDATVKKHQEISRNMVNEILDTLHIRK